MAESFGPGVSRTLSAVERAFNIVVHQKDKPPLDADINLLQQIDWERLSEFVRVRLHSGFVMDPVRALDDYVTDETWSNFFVLGDPADSEQRPVVWANVNGWLIPVAGTGVTLDTDLQNLVKLSPPPSSSSRIDLVFLEAWLALVDPNPSTTNKPAADKVWKYGNVEYGATNIDDDLVDPTIAFEVTKRVQLQYRLRVFGQGTGLGASVALDVYPDGLGDPNILGQATSTAVVAGFPFTNMREALGDPSLWRAGDGDPANNLGTTDGYTYAVPICAVFRRNTSTFVAVTDAGNPNQNGGFDRNPSAVFLTDPREGAKAFNIPELNQDIDPDTVGIVEVNNLLGSGLDDPKLNGGAGVSLTNPIFVVIEGEIIKVVGVDATVSPGEIIIDTSAGRGRYATHATGHLTDTTIAFFNVRPDGLWADQVSPNDFLDLRRGVSLDEWDYSELLLNNVAALIRGELKTTWKQSATGTGSGPTQGVSVQEIGYLHADGGTAAPNATEAVDGPDGIRTIFSDAATIQPDVTVLCDDQAALVNGFTSTTFDQTVGWEVGADFQPSGFMNNLGANGWANGSIVFLYLGGTTGDDGARSTFRAANTRAVRFVGPREYFKSGFPVSDPTNGRQAPFEVRWLEEVALEPAAPGRTATDHPGPQAPIQDQAFERPFIVLGGLLQSSLDFSGIDTTTDLINPGADDFEVDLGINFDTAGSFYPTAGVTVEDPSAVAIPLVRSQTVLYSMLTDSGRDRTGLSSDVYLILYDDTGSTTNNGAFQVIGAGTTAGKVGTENYTDVEASAATRVVVRPLSYGVVTSEGGTGLWDATATPLRGQLRSQITNSEDGGGFASGPAAADVALVLTDLRGISGGTDNPWFLFTDVVAENPSPPASPVPNGALLGPFTMNTTNFPVEPGTLSVTIDISATPSVATDDGAGSLIPSAFISAGTINYATGAISVTYNGGFAPDGPPFILDYRYQRNSLNPPLTQKMLLNTTVQYHPGRGATARVPGDIWRVALRNGDSTYLRQAPGVVDTVFPGETGMPASETFYSPVNVQLWNDLPTLGLGAGIAPDFGGNVVAQSEQDREHEAFVDKGSKTLVFRPFQRNAMVLAAIDTLATPSLLGSLNYPTADPKDAAGIWTTSKTLGFAIPSEFMPRFGRQDIPFRLDTTGGSGPHLQGISHLFTDATDATQPVFQVIGGEDNNTAGNLVIRILFQTGDVGLTGLTYGQRGVLIGPSPDVVQARKQNLPAVISSDLGSGLDGIELPPYHGIARLYGVYERADFIAKSGLTFEDDRVTLKVDPPTNLLRVDADQQTLFIREDGASDLTLETGDHTYIVPFEAIDITKISTFVAGNGFTDFDYVVECSVFGFAKGFITDNNYALVRLHDGQGNLQTDSTPFESSGVNLTIPTPAKLNDPVYVGLSRTPYQGDPYMTRDGLTRTVSDYEHRYGQIAVSDAFELNTPLPQVDANGDPFVETPNLRSFEVLASIDFFTTLGTGNIGGTLYPGTVLDVGYTEDTVLSASRLPNSPSDPPARILTRVFSEGQKENSSRATMGVQIFSTSGLEDATVTVTTLDGVQIQMVAKLGGNYDANNQNHFEIKSTPALTATELAQRLLSHLNLKRTLTAFAESSSAVLMTAVPVGSEGNGIRVEISALNATGDIRTLMRLVVNEPFENNPQGFTTAANFRGGIDLPVNAGNGTTQLRLTGLTERLPLGILLQDSDFVGENPLNDEASAFKTSPSGIRPVQTLLPLTEDGGEEFTRFLGEPGALVAMSDGAILAYSAYPAGTRKFRLFRGGGASFVLSGRNPGGPIDWVSESFPVSIRPVLKGGILTCKALLVRNFFEDAFSPTARTTDGDELQMVLLTHGILGDGLVQETGVLLNGEISPTGYGEGYAAADRYRLLGKPMYHGRSRDHQDPDTVALAIFPGRD